MSAVSQSVIDWLLDGDVAIQYQARRDLLGDDRPALRKRIAKEGWGAQFLAGQHPDTSWGLSFYQPKWTSTHYTLLDLKALGVDPGNAKIRRSIDFIVETCKGVDGGINPSGTINQSDVCINGMFLNYGCYFGVAEEGVHSIVDFILSQQMDDGGFNCMKNRSGARHSSLHTTINTVEGIAEYADNGYDYRLKELLKAAAESREFILQHRLFKSDHTGEIIKDEFLRFSYPARWRYNILRALDYFQQVGEPYDERMADALEVVKGKQKPDGRWVLQAKHPGKTHFEMEKTRQPSRWNTLLALRVLKAYDGNR